MRKHRYIIRAALIVVLLLIHSANTTRASEPNWPQFRGPGGLGIAPDNQTYPTELDFSRNLLWKTEVPKGHSSPCIWGDSIFITARSGKSLETICIARGNGTIKWRKALEPKRMERISGFNSHATPTPVCDGKKVYVYFGSFGLLAYDVEGSELWRKPLPNPYIGYGSASSPVLANDMVVINCDSRKGAYILAVDQDTGETIWRQERQVHGLGWATPVLWKHRNEQELVVHGVGQLISYDLKDGRKRWWFDFLQSTMTGAALTPVYAGDTLFVAAAVGRTGDPVNPVELPDFKELLEMHDSDKDNRLVQAEIPEDLSYIYRRGPELTGVRSHFSELDTDKDGAISKAEWNKVVIDIKKTPPKQFDALFAISAGGKDNMSKSLVKWTANEGIGQVSSPLFYQGRIYLVKHGSNVTCYDTKTGDKIYGDRAGPRTYYFASPVAADNKIYFCSMNGVIIVVQAGDKFKILAQNKIGERIYATPALVDGNIYLRTDKNMYTFYTKDDSGKKPLDIVVKVENDQAKTLYEAAADGDIELVKSLISSGADVNATNDWGWTPLYVAAVIGNGDIVNLLIAKGAHVDEPNQPRETPLHLAVSNGHRDIVELLIEKGADFRAADEDGVTPLHTTAEHGYIDIATLLIDKGADVNAKDKWIWTPLHYACWKNHKDTAEFLITKGADFRTADEDGDTPLHTTAAQGHIDIATLLIDKGADVNAKNNSGQSPLHLAFQRGNKEVTKLLIDKGADINMKNRNGLTPLHLAARIGLKDVVELLLTKGADINAGNNSGQTPLHLAFQRGNKEVTELLIEKGADINIKDNNGLMPLHLAAGSGQKDVVELLLTKGADFKAQNSGGRTAVGIAKEKNHTEIVELLRKHANQSGDTKEIMTFYDYAAVGDIEQIKSFESKGMDINAKAQDGMTALHWAAIGHRNVAEYLISKGTDINTKNNNGWTPLHIAARSDRKNVVELLISKGADINTKNNDGLTPLHLAARSGWKDVVELLVAKGADTNVKNNAGRTPLNLATNRGHTEIVELLRKHGAKD